MAPMIKLALLTLAIHVWEAATSYVVEETWVRRDKRRQSHCRGECEKASTGHGVEEPWVRRAKRAKDAGAHVEMAAKGQFKRKDNVNTIAPPESPKSSLRCQVGKSLMMNASARQFVVDTFNDVVDAQECALLCHSYAECTFFYHVKSPTNALFKQCVLTKWKGQLAQLQASDCCDSGFPCSANEMTAPIVAEIQALKQRAANTPPQLERNGHLYGEQISSQQHEIARLKNALGIQQRVLVLRDFENAKAKDAISRKAKELNALKDENKHYWDVMTKSKEEDDRLKKENRALRQHDNDNSKLAAVSVARVGDQEKYIQHLHRALGIKQQIIKGTDVDKEVQEHIKERLSAETKRLAVEVDSLSVLIKQQTRYIHVISATLAFTIALALPIGTYIALNYYTREQKSMWAQMQ